MCECVCVSMCMYMCMCILMCMCVYMYVCLIRECVCVHVDHGVHLEVSRPSERVMVLLHYVVSGDPQYRWPRVP